MDKINLLSGGEAKSDIIDSREEGNIINWSKLDSGKKKKGFMALFSRSNKKSVVLEKPVEKKQITPFVAPVNSLKIVLPPSTKKKKFFWGNLFVRESKNKTKEPEKIKQPIIKIASEKKMENSLLYSMPPKSALLKNSTDIDIKSGQINLLTKMENEIVAQNLNTNNNDDAKLNLLNEQAKSVVNQKQNTNRSFLSSVFGNDSRPEANINPKQTVVPSGLSSKKIKWENPHVLQSNLMTEEVVSYIDWNKNISIAVIFFFLSLVVLGSAYWGLSTQEKQEKAILEQHNERLADIDNMIKKVSESNKKNEAIKKKVDSVSSLLNSHVYWTNFFKFLEENTIPSVRYTNFSGDVGGIYVLQVVAKDYVDVTKLVKAMRSSDKVINAWADSATNNRSSVNFSLNLTIKPEIFYKR